MLIQVINHSKQIIYQNPDTQRVYRRVVGGIGWPFEPMAGFLVVLGEQYSYDQGLKGRPLEVLAEREVGSIYELHRACLEFRALWQCHNWLADLKQKEAVRLFKRIDRGDKFSSLTTETEPVTLRSAPYSHGDGKLQVLFQLLGMVQSQERKLLSYGSNSNLPAHALGLDRDKMNQPAAKFPALAALGYAVAEMVLRQPRDKNAEPQVITNWDRFA